MQIVLTKHAKQQQIKTKYVYAVYLHNLLDTIPHVN